MVSKIILVVVLSVAVFQVTEARSALEDDFSVLVKPVTDAYSTLQKKFQEAIHAIQENPLFKNTAGVINDKYSQTQKGLFATYDKLSTCRKIIFDQENAGPAAPAHFESEGAAQSAAAPENFNDEHFNDQHF